MKEKISLKLILLLILLLLSIIFFWAFKYQNNNVVSIQDSANKNIKIDTFTKQEIKRADAFNALASRTDEGIKKSIDIFKDIYRSQDSRAYQKAVALQKLATLYWRTGGNEKVIDYIYTGDFEKYKDKTILLSNIKLLKKSFEIWPLSRTAIEISFAYIADGDIENGKKWLEKYNELKGEDGMKTFTLYREFLVHRVLAKIESGHDTEVENLYESAKTALEYDSKTVLENRHNYYAQSLPFLNVFYASYLADKDAVKNKEKIDALVDEIISFVKNDKNQQQNEFVYFLNVQKDKQECDYICRTFIKSLAGASEKFKSFVLSYGLSESCNK